MYRVRSAASPVLRAVFNIRRLRGRGITNESSLIFMVVFLVTAAATAEEHHFYNLAQNRARLFRNRLS
jgi:hypothetical protein